jgi:hypothetical protein
MSKGIALETIELGNRPDQNKKEGSNQKSQFGMKGEKSLLRLGQNDGQSAEEFGGFVEFGGVYEAQHRLQQNSECHQQHDIGNGSEREMRFATKATTRSPPMSPRMRAGDMMLPSRVTVEAGIAGSFESLPLLNNRSLPLVGTTRF